MIPKISQLLFYFFIIPPFSYAAHTLSVNQSLSGDQTLVSPGGKFEMGFFKPGKSPNYYIGIWYSTTIVNTVPPTIVWVANRDTPVFDTFSSKLLIIDCNLVLLDKLNTQIWSTNMNCTTDAGPVSVVLLDDGNLVLRYGSNSNQPIWQSFDHPTHTFLPGGKLGFNKLTNTKQSITSWRSGEDPGMGLFSVEIDQYKDQFVLKWNKSETYWSSGSWDEQNQRFALVQEMRVNSIFNYSYVDKENESYFTYFPINPLLITRFVIDHVSGQNQQLSWLDTTQSWILFSGQPQKICDVYNRCGSFGVCNQILPFCKCLTGFKPRSDKEWNESDFSSGCVRKTNLSCWRNTEMLDFLMIKVTSMPLNSSVSVKSVGECRAACLNSCSCNAYAFVDNNCSVWDGELLNLSEDNVEGKSIYVKISSKDLPRYKENNRVVTAIVVAPVTSAIFVLIVLMIIVYQRKSGLIGKTKMEGSLVAFGYKDLKKATKNFSEELGKGGFGSVYKGVLHDSSIVAVKKLESVNQGDKQFRSEVSTIGTIQHVNLVRLRGFCAQGNNKLLVYDYMPNGSLHSHLFHGKQDGVLNWETRYHIALGIARGLVYLHEKCRDCIIHCDIKPENILLDANFCPKVADFGLAKIIGRDFSRVLTTLRGTAGYLAPEWLDGLAVTVKADVFSYGMMLFELVSGKRNVEQTSGSNFTFFPSLAAYVVMPRGDILTLLDTRLNREASVEQVTRIFKVAYWCIQDNVDSRPSMSQVEQVLEGVLDAEMPTICQEFRITVRLGFSMSHAKIRVHKP